MVEGQTPHVVCPNFAGPDTAASRRARKRAGTPQSPGPGVANWQRLGWPAPVPRGHPGGDVAPLVVLGGEELLDGRPLPDALQVVQEFGEARVVRLAREAHHELAGGVPPVK